MECINRYFHKYSPSFCKKMSMAIEGITGSGSSSTGLVANFLCTIYLFTTLGCLYTDFCRTVPSK
ncbi:MAG: hypothetical protein LBP31_01545 [Holosporales bacterium]|nr:hypothetical protein [Holosporales bacterium]